MKSIQELVGKTISEIRLSNILEFVFTDKTYIWVQNDGYESPLEVQTNIDKEVTEIRTIIISLER